MGMSHCSQTGHSLVPELFQDATQRKPTGSCLEIQGKNGPEDTDGRTTVSLGSPGVTTERLVGDMWSSSPDCGWECCCRPEEGLRRQWGLGGVWRSGWCSG